VAEVAGVQLQERALRPGDLGEFTECFATSTTQDIVPVTCVGERRFTLGRGTLTRRLKSAFRAYVDAYNAAHPEYRVG
jgi:branched-subunit amino acid aminotransferase/4-amino-4-deoxychorismate lyase